MSSDSTTIAKLRSEINAMQKRMAMLQSQLYERSQPRMRTVPIHPREEYHGGFEQPHYTSSSYGSYSHARDSSRIRGTGVRGTGVRGTAVRGSLTRRPYEPRDQENRPRASRIQRMPREENQEIKTIQLSQVLSIGETVEFRVITGKDEKEELIYATASAIFDGTHLVVTECEKVGSIVGTKSTKAGELLYKFIDGLVEASVLRRKFKIAPWRLCFVKRGEETLCLNDLRAQVVAETPSE